MSARQHLNAHRLIWLAGEEACRTLSSKLYSVLFRRGRDVGDTKVLAEIAKRRPLLPVVANLPGRTAGTEESASSKDREDGGISGVPTFILDGEELFSGAMKPNTWPRVCARQ